MPSKPKRGQQPTQPAPSERWSWRDMQGCFEPQNAIYGASEACVFASRAEAVENAVRTLENMLPSLLEGRIAVGKLSAVEPAELLDAEAWVEHLNDRPPKHLNSSFGKLYLSFSARADAELRAWANAHIRAIPGETIRDEDAKLIPVEEIAAVWQSLQTAKLAAALARGKKG